MHADAVRLLRSAITAKDWALCREVLRFLHSIDETGTTLRDCLSETQLIDATNGIPINGELHSH